MAEEFIRAAPGEWERTTLGVLCERGLGGVQTGPFGSQLHASDYVDAGVPSVMPVNIGDNRIVEAGIARVREQDADRLARHRLQVGDIVYSRRGDVERRALVRETEAGWLCGTGCLRVRPGRDANSEWLSYYLGHPEVREWIVRHAVGATMPNLNTGVLSALPVVVPGKWEQRAIAEVLEAFDAKIDDNARITAICEALAILHLERTSERRPVSAFALVEREQLKPEQFAGIVVEHFSLPAFDSARLPDRCSGGTIKSNKFLLTRPAVLVSKLNPHIPRVWLASPTEGMLALASTEFVALRPKAGHAAALLWAACAAPTFVSALGELVTGTTGSHQRVRPQDVLDAPVVDLDVVSQGVRELVEGLVHRARAARRENERLVSMREMLLPPLLSGEIRVRDVGALAGEVL